MVYIYKLFTSIIEQKDFFNYAKRGLVRLHRVAVVFVYVVDHCSLSSNDLSD
jgi:hypothetical protein